MIYFHVTVQVQRGKVDEWAARYEKDFLPMAKRHGQRLVGAWKTSIGPYDEATDLYVFDSLAEFERIRQEMSKDPDMIKMMANPSRGAYLVNFESSKIMVPFSYSPLQ